MSLQKLIPSEVTRNGWQHAADLPLRA